MPFQSSNAIVEKRLIERNLNDEYARTSSVVNRILVTTDISAAANVAVTHAAELARAHNAVLQVLYVKPPLDPREVFAPDKLPQVDHVEDHLERMHRRFPDLRVHTSQEMGDLAAIICDVAKRLRSDIIVMAYRSTNGKKRLRPRSVPKRVMRHSPCSVFLVDARTAQ